MNCPRFNEIFVCKLSLADIVFLTLDRPGALSMSWCFSALKSLQQIWFSLTGH